MSDGLRLFFNERISEIEEYLTLVEALEQGVQSGGAVIGTQEMKVTVTQQKVLCSSVYLHLYNLVEATVTKCIGYVEDAASKGASDSPSQLSDNLRREWVRTIAKTHVPLNPNKRLDAAVEMCNHIVGMLPVKVSIDKDGGGNWDDEEIYEFTKRIGLQLDISSEGNRAAKSKIKDDMGALKLVKHLRNKLAHGELSFGECGDGVTHSQLRELKDSVFMYLDEVIDSFESYVTSNGYLADIA